jgi:hypothetical protein
MLRSVFFSFVLLLGLTGSLSANSYPAAYRLPDTLRVVQGSAFVVPVTFSTEEGWYLYAPTGVNASQGMIETNVICLPPKGIVRSGKPVVPEPHFKGGFEVYEGKDICFKQAFQADKDLEPGSYAIKVKVTYQACGNEVCMPPVTEERVVTVMVGRRDCCGKERVKQ